jgi:hypothetical protein
MRVNSSPRPSGPPGPPPPPGPPRLARSAVSEGLVAGRGSLRDPAALAAYLNKSLQQTAAAMWVCWDFLPRRAAAAAELGRWA